MKVIIAGSRGITAPWLVQEAVKASGFTITEVVCGMARGVDELGRQWAIENKIPVKEFPADWDIGPAAGFIRNKLMAEYADALICIHVNSGGSAHMMRTALKKKMPIFEVKVCPSCIGTDPSCGVCNGKGTL